MTVNTLKQAVLQTDWLAVADALHRLYPEHFEYMALYQAAYSELNHTEPTTTGLWIKIGQYEPNSVLPFYIVGFYGDCPKGYCIKFIPWSDWLGIDLNTEVSKQFNLAEILAICLNEMCWAGFSADDVARFKREFTGHEDCLWAVFAHEEAIDESEFNLIKRKQRSNEFNEALQLYGIDDDDVFLDDGSDEYRQARFQLGVEIYCLGETETDYLLYCEKVTALKDDFRQRWA